MLLLLLSGGSQIIIKSKKYEMNKDHKELKSQDTRQKFSYGQHWRERESAKWAQNIKDSSSTK